MSVPGTYTTPNYKFAAPMFLAPAPGQLTQNYAAATAGVQLKSGAGIFFGINVNTAQASVVLTAYDGTNTSGRNLGAYSCAAQGPINLVGGGLLFTTGLFLVITVLSTGNLTVVYQ